MTRSFRTATAAAALAAGLLGVRFIGADPIQQPPPPSTSGAPTAPPGAKQDAKVDVGPVSIPITVREQFLGKSGDKTVVRFILSVSRSELSQGMSPRLYSFYIAGDARDPSGKIVHNFRVPLEVDLSNVDISKPIEASFLQSLPPGKLELAFRLDGVAGNALGLTSLSVEVPAMKSEFVAGDAGPLNAAAIILEAENREAVPADTSSLLKILPPPKEVPIGLLRVECEVKPPVTRVEFYLEDKKILVRNRPPYTVELDLGQIPRRQTLKAVGFDAKGNFIDTDAWAINEREARLAVRILELPKTGGDTMELKVAVQSIAGGMARTLKLYADDQLLHEWKRPPYTISVSAAQVKKATLLRATATDEEGKEFSDMKFLKGDSRFVSSVEVNLVELNVSVFDKEGRFRKDLKKEDFTVLEDGKKQDIGAFEFAESLPISLGVVIDGSGSMREAMPTVHQVASEFVQKLVGEKDQGFVMEFREQPVLLASMTKNVANLVRAIAETRPAGGTALYDCVVMALYQFRSVAGKKALVVLSDGKDNHSWTEYETLRRYARSARVPIYVIGLDISFLDVGLKGKINDLAGDTGAEAFYVKGAGNLGEIYKRVETELRSQYFVTYMTSSTKPETEFRTVEVKLKDTKLTAKTIRGYFP